MGTQKKSTRMETHSTLSPSLTLLWRLRAGVRVVQPSTFARLSFVSESVHPQRTLPDSLSPEHENVDFGGKPMRICVHCQQVLEQHALITSVLFP